MSEAARAFPGVRESEERCPDCGGELAGHPAMDRCPDYISGDDFRVARCQACHLAWTRPFPLPGELSRYYPAEYYGTITARRFPLLVEWLQNGLYRARARAVERRAGGSPGRVLDVGCGKGFLLDAFRRRGWTVQGVELSDGSARHAREVLGLPVHVGDLESLPPGHGTFDAAVLWHVLEHFDDPRQLLVHLHGFLRPGGILLLSVPNFGSWEARACGAGWFHLDLPRHLVHFTPETLTRLLSEVGYTVLARRPFAPEFDLFSFIQSWENRLGLDMNALYRFLRGRGARVGARDLPTPSVLAALLVAVPLGLAGMAGVLAAGWTGSPSTLTLVVQRDPDPLEPPQEGARA